MSYKTILVHTDPGNRCEVAIEVAISMAKQHDAHLIALYAQAPFVFPGYLMEVSPQITEAQQIIAAEEKAKTKAIYNNLVASMGCKKSEWLSTIDYPVDAVTRQARYADLVIVRQRDPVATTTIAKGFLAQLVLTACRPVLIIPYTGSFLSIGRRILIAWNGSREATRAITDALPLLKRAETVNLIAMMPKHATAEHIPVADIVLYLARHGVTVESSTEHAADIKVGNVLLSRVADLNSDLLVMGGYGHSRLREWVLGGATRLILESMTVPVLMSH